MNSKQFLMISMAAIAPLGLLHAKKKATEKPNMLFIFPDQYRFSALSLWQDPAFKDLISTVGDPVKTPNIDKLAKQGVLFTRATSVFPLSSPMRSMLMSGMFPANNGIPSMNCKLGRPYGLHHNIECFTDVLASNGYNTAYVGKTHWHRTEALFDKDGTYVGTTEDPGGHSISPFDTYIPEGPSRHSNEVWFQQLNDNHFNAITYSNIPWLIEGKKDGVQHRPKGFTTINEANVIIDYIENKNDIRDPNKPFSVIWSINPPHPPYSRLSDCEPEVYNENYRDLELSELMLRENVHVLKDPTAVIKGEKNIAQVARIYFSLIMSVDREIGRVMEALEKSGEADKTIVVFTSDHGEMLGSHNLMGKPQIENEAFLVPFIIRYPDKLKHRSEDLLFNSVDIMPTMLGLCGLSNEIPSSVEGVDYSQGLEIGKIKNKPLSAPYLTYRSKGIMTDRYTYKVNEDGSYVLYDNEQDPYQLNNLRLEDISAKDAAFIKAETGSWIVKSSDPWSNKKLFPNLITYPSK